MQYRKSTYTLSRSLFLKQLANYYFTLSIWTIQFAVSQLQNLEDRSIFSKIVTILKQLELLQLLIMYGERIVTFCSFYY